LKPYAPLLEPNPRAMKLLVNGYSANRALALLSEVEIDLHQFSVVDNSEITVAPNLAPKSKAHVRSMIRLLWDYAMWSGSIPVQRNPMELVTVKGATKRLHKPRDLTAVEFQKLIAHLAEPFRTLALLSVSFGLRISEALALKWNDMDWLNQTLNIERRIVAQHVDAKKRRSHNARCPWTLQCLMC
jgi:integrase